MIARVLILTAVIGATALEAQGAATDDARLRERYLKSALSNPRRGTAVERLYQLAAQTEGIDTLIERIGAMPPGESDARRWTLVGLIEEMRGKDEAALAALKRAADADEKAHYPRFVRGSILLHRNQYAPAVESLLAALELNPPLDDAIEIQKALGRAYLRSRKIEAATKTWSALARIAPDDPITLQELTMLLVDEEQWEEALQYYKRLRTLQKDRPYQVVLTTIAMGNVEARRGQFEAALERFEEALTKAAPGSWLASEIRTHIADLFRRRNDLTGLVKYYQTRLESTDATDVQLMVRLAELLVELDRAKEARPWYEKAIDLAPKNENVRVAYIRLLEEAKELPAAVKQYEALLEQNPKQVAHLEALGRLHLDAGGDGAESKARALWERIAALNPEDPATMVQVAEIFRDAKLNDDAGRYFQRAIELAPGVGQYREYYGEFLIGIDRRDDALAAIKQMAEGSRRNSETLLRLSDVAGYFEFAEEALAAARSAVELKPDHFEARMRLAELLGERDQFDEALAELDRASKVAPNPFFAREVVDKRIRLLDRAGRLQETFDKKAEALTAKPAQTAEPYIEGAKMAMALRLKEPAVALVTEALKKEPNAAPILELAARIYERSGDHERRSETLGKLIEVAPQNRGDYQRQLAEHHARLGDAEAAVKAAEAVIDAGPDNPAGYQLLATLCERFGMADRSVAILKEAVKVDPKNVDLRLQYGQRLDRSGDVDQALEQYWLAFDAHEEVDDKLSVMRTLADLYYGAGKFEQLVDRLERKRRLTRDDWVPTLCLAEAYRQIEDFAKSRVLLTSLLTERPDEASLLSQVVRLAKAEGLKEQAAEHLLRLVELEPSRRNLSQLGELLFELERKDEAIATWRRAAESSDDASRALSDAATRFLERELYDAAIDLLADYDAREPDDWRTAYLYGMALLGAERTDDADRVFARIADLPDLPEPKKPDDKSKKSQTAQRHAYYQQLPPEYVRVQKLYSLRHELAPRSGYYSSRSSPRVFMPPELDTARTAAWYQHCRIAKENDRYDEIVESLKEANTPRAAWQLVQMYAMEQRASKELYGAVQNLRKLSPDDVAVKILCFEQMISAGRGNDVEVSFEEIRSLFRELTESRADLAMYVGASWMRYLQRGGKKDELEAYVDALTSRGFTSVRDAAMVISTAIQAEMFETASDLLRRAEEQFGASRQPSRGLSLAHAYPQLMSLALRKDLPDRAAELLVEHLRRTRPQSPQLGRGYSPFRSYTYRAGRIYGGGGSYGIESFPNVTAYYDSSRLQVLDQFFQTTTAEPDAEGSGQVRPKAGIRQRIQQATSKPATSTQPGQPATQPAEKKPKVDAPALLAARKRFEADLGSESEDDRVYAHLALAYLDWWSAEREAASRHVAEVVKLRPWDASLALALAQVPYQMDDQKGALDALNGIRRRYHATYKPAQQLSLRIARELGETEAAKTAALRLFSMRLASKEQIELVAAMRELGLTGKAEQVERRIRNVSSGDLSQLVNLMQGHTSRDEKDKAASSISCRGTRRVTRRTRPRRSPVRSSGMWARRSRTRSTTAARPCGR